MNVNKLMERVKLLRQKRKDKIEMEIKLTKEACFLVYRMFWQPGTLSEDKAYQAKDDQARAELVKIQEWLSTKVFGMVDKGTPQERFDFKPFTGKIKQRYIDRLLQVLKHYEKSGMLIQNCTVYSELLAGLTGKADDTESVEEA